MERNYDTLLILLRAENAYHVCLIARLLNKRVKYTSITAVVTSHTAHQQHHRSNVTGSISLSLRIPYETT